MFARTSAAVRGITISGVPHQIVHTAVSVDPQREVHWYQRRLKVAVHDEVRVRQPDISVMVDGVQEVVPALV